MLALQYFQFFALYNLAAHQLIKLRSLILSKGNLRLKKLLPNLWKRAFKIISFNPRRRVLLCVDKPLRCGGSPRCSKWRAVSTAGLINQPLNQSEKPPIRMQTLTQQIHT